VRDGTWMLVEYYDAEACELYDLSADVGEKNDLAAKHPDRVAALRAALAAWRTSVDAQGNTPNPDCDPALYRQLYVDTDASRFDPAHADDAEWARIQEWRKGMNSAPPVNPQQKKNRKR
jgi:hypothetical protein